MNTLLPFYLCCSGAGTDYCECPPGHMCQHCDHGDDTRWKS